MATKRAKKAPIALLEALNFIYVAQRATGSDLERHCMIANGMLTAFNGLIAAGIAIDEPLRCCPQTSRLMAALEYCEPGFHISHSAADRLVVQSGEFIANVPLIEPSLLQWAIPDAKLITVDDTLKAALMAVVGVTNDKSDRVHESAILMQAQTCMATNGTVILESWHGWDLPPNILLPKAAIVALSKTRKQLTGIGYGDTTVTFWFADRSWIRTQRFLADWPKSELLSTRTRPTPLPSQLFVAVAQLAPFSEDGQIYCWQSKASSHPFLKPNAFNGQIRADVPGIVESRVYQLSALVAISQFATSYDDVTLRNRTFVYGIAKVKIGTKKAEVIEVKMRGVLSHATEQDRIEAPLPTIGNMETWSLQTLCDCGSGLPVAICDCVPF